MTQKFHDGQDVEVAVRVPVLSERNTDPPRYSEMHWRKAKIVREPYGPPGFWLVEFPDSTRGVFDAEHIRAIADPHEGLSPLDYAVKYGPGHVIE